MSASASARTVLVTGAAKRLGREIALALAKDGWQVAVHYRNSREDATKTVADCEERLPPTVGLPTIMGWCYLCDLHGSSTVLVR